MTSIAEQIGRVVGGRYRLLAPVGAGASSQVYAASDTRLARRVAVKVLHPMLAADRAFLRRFRAEARLAASLDHPHIMRVFDWGEEDEGPYLVLEYLGGGSLRGLLDTGVHLSHSQVAVLGTQAASGLAYAHRRGIVHRDIKPSNLLFDDEGHIRIADFGVARALAEAALTEPLGAIFGTARYASPEQAEGRPLDDRTDVYSLALVLYESLTGRVPFTADTITAMLMARVGAVLPPARELGPLAPILAQAAISEPVARLDAVAFHSDLELLARELPPPEPLPLARTSATVGPPKWSDGDPTVMDGASSAAVADEVGLESLEPPDRAAGDITLLGLGSEVASPAAGFATGGLAGVSDPELAGVIPHPPPATATATGDSTAPHPPPSAQQERSPRQQERSPRQKHKYGRWVVVLVVILVLAGAAATGVTLAEQRAELFNHVVPHLQSLQLGAAESAARHAGLEAKETSSRWDATVPAGVVIAQSIRAGRHIRLHSVIGLDVSKGVEPVPVPSLTNDSLLVAEGLLNASHLHFATSYAYSPTVPRTKIVSWSPQNQSVAPGTTVQLVVSQGPAPRPVPSVPQSYDYAQAEKLLSAEGFVPKQLEAYSTSVAAGDVISTSPDSASGPQSYGSTVIVTISKGPEYFRIPGLFGDSVQTASRRLEQLGFVPVPEGRGFVVVGTYPSSGQLEPQGSRVLLFVV
jgi:serine/threonine protein kinase/beta-lactam-binding protein with PASTA domain